MRPSVLVVPCYNEERRLDGPALLAFAQTQSEIGLLFVNDGSTDQTAAVLTHLCAQSHGVAEALLLERNGGKAEAVRQGVLRAFAQGAQQVGYWDADLAAPLDQAPRLLEVLRERPEVEVAIGSRVMLAGRQIERKPLRHYLGRASVTLVDLLVGMPIMDTQCGAKFLRSSPAVMQAFAQPFTAGWLFDVELLCRLRQITGRPVQELAYEVPLDQWCDVGASKIRGSSYLRSLGDLLRIRRQYGRTRRSR